MTQIRENGLNQESRFFRQFPLDNTRLAYTCKMTGTQANSIRDMGTKELQQQTYVTPAEFAYLTGRTLKSVRNMMDREQIPVHREGMPGSKRPKRFVMLQEYWESVLHCRALITPDEKSWIDRLLRDRATYQRTTGRNAKTHKRNSHAQKYA